MTGEQLQQETCDVVRYAQPFVVIHIVETDGWTLCGRQVESDDMFEVGTTVWDDRPESQCQSCCAILATRG